jgi:hypothetical protein
VLQTYFRSEDLGCHLAAEVHAEEGGVFGQISFQGHRQQVKLVRTLPWRPSPVVRKALLKSGKNKEPFRLAEHLLHDGSQG